MTQSIAFKSTVYNFLFVGLTLIVIGWLSVFTYGMFYYVYVPAVSHVRPVFLQFDTSCNSGVCRFPHANITLAKRGYDQLLSRGQPYKIVLELEMPESETNRRLGMFMVKLSMYARDGQILKSSFRSALMHYRSPLLRCLYTLVFSPFLLVGSVEEKQTVSVSLFEHYEEDPEKSAYGAFIELHSHSIEVYSASLRIHADFTGLRYFMYYWPGLSTTIGITTNLYFLVMIALFSWYRFLMWREKGLEDSFPPAESAAADSTLDLGTTDIPGLQLGADEATEPYFENEIEELEFPDAERPRIDELVISPADAGFSDSRDIDAGSSNEEQVPRRRIK